MTTVTIPESANLKKRAVNFDFRWQRAPRLQNCGTRSGATQADSMESVSLRRLVGVARGPLRLGSRLETIGPIGSRPALDVIGELMRNWNHKIQ